MLPEYVLIRTRVCTNLMKWIQQIRLFSQSPNPHPNLIIQKQANINCRTKTPIDTLRRVMQVSKWKFYTPFSSFTKSASFSMNPVFSLEPCFCISSPTFYK